MADMIAKLKVDSSEYDAKIKRAAQGLTHLAESAKTAGTKLTELNDDNRDYIKSLGNMETVAKDARGKMNELTKAFTDLSHIYKNLSEEEKNSEFGRELNKQLETLKTRAKDAKQELNDIDKELKDTEKDEKGTANGIQAITSALGINIKSLVGWGAALGAAKAALGVAKDAFFASEATVDEWGRIVASSQSLYQGFLTALNNGDISGYLGRMDDIVNAARAAYDEMDRLGTMKTIQAPKVSAQQTENERIRMMIQTGRYIAPVDGRSNAVFNGAVLQNGDKLTAGQIRALEKHLQNGMQQVVKLVGNEVQQTGKAINAYYNSLAQQNGMSLEEFKKGTSSWEEFEKRINGAAELNRWKNEHSRYNSITRTYDYDAPIPDNLKAFAGWQTFRVDKMGENSFNELVDLIKQRDQQAAQAYSMQSQAYRTMNRAEGFTVRSLMKGDGGGGGGATKKEIEEASQGVAALTAELRDLQKEQQQSTNPQQWDGYQQKIDEITERIKEMKGELPNIELGGMPRMQGVSIAADYLANARKRGTLPTRESILAQGQTALRGFKGVDTSDKKTQVNMAKELSQITSGVSGIFSGIESLGVELPQGLKDVLGGIQGMISILTSISTIISAIEAISAADAIIPFARGGIVMAAGGTLVGNSYSGDNLRGIGPGGQVYGLNAGEVVLNRAQVGNIAQQLQGSGMDGLKLSARLDGDDILLCLDRTLSVQGKGQLVAFK